MTPEDHELFKKHMPLYECYKKHAFIRNYGKEEYNDMIHLYTTYVNAKHTFSHWCSSCRMELVNYLYGWYTNTAHTTWYADQEEVPTPEAVVEPAPTKRTRKTNETSSSNKFLATSIDNVNISTIIIPNANTSTTISGDAISTPTSNTTTK